MISPILGKRIQEIRKSNSLSLDELGKIINLHKGSLSGIENGKKPISLESVVNIAAHFNVSVDYLLGRTDNPEINK